MQCAGSVIGSFVELNLGISKLRLRLPGVVYTCLHEDVEHVRVYIHVYTRMHAHRQRMSTHMYKKIHINGIGTWLISEWVYVHS